MTETSNSEAACPVDHKSREAWLEQAKRQPAPTKPARSALEAASSSCNSSELDQTLPTPKASSSHGFTFPRLLASRPAPTASGELATQREVSTIPRASIPGTDTAARPANHEVESGASAAGNWIYPSEQMFFNAMKRKNYDPKTEDMRSIIPIHNAVNERAWKEIKEWERGRGADKCGGPRLESFSGTATSMTPRARINTLLGYTAPFDRHDWVIDRCGTKVDYVIDFYSGKQDASGKGLSFYLDVRPKLNSWEGCKMRIERMVGYS